MSVFSAYVSRMLFMRANTIQMLQCQFRYSFYSWMPFPTLATLQHELGVFFSCHLHYWGCYAPCWTTNLEMRVSFMLEDKRVEPWGAKCSTSSCRQYDLASLYSKVVQPQSSLHFSLWFSVDKIVFSNINWVWSAISYSYFCRPNNQVKAHPFSEGQTNIGFCPFFLITEEVSNVIFKWSVLNHFPQYCV